MGAEQTMTDESKQILIAVTELKTNVNHLATGVEEIKKMSTIILETDQRAKSAHNRIDDLKNDLEKKLVDQKAAILEKVEDNHKDFVDLKGDIKWIWRAIGGGAITLVFWFITNIDKFFN